MPTLSVPPAPLTLEEYAAVTARLLQSAGKPTADVLAELRISLDAWQATAIAWERALDEDLAHGRNKLLVDSRSLPRAPEPKAEVPIPLVCIKRPAGLLTWIARLWRWFWGLLRLP